VERVLSDPSSYDQCMGRAIATALVAFATILSGCGGPEGPAENIAGVAKDYYEASGVSCSKEGVMVFVGAREDVYGCVVDDVPANRPRSTRSSRRQIRACYVYSNDELFEVTEKLQDLAAAQEASGGSVDEFSCVSVTDN
jgi:hypothetical protein